MSGIFEDDEHVRQKPQPKSNVADKLLKKAGAKLSLVDLASNVSAASPKFDEIDFNKLNKAAKTTKVDDGKITPIINYVSDENG